MGVFFKLYMRAEILQATKESYVINNRQIGAIKHHLVLLVLYIFGDARLLLTNVGLN